MKAYITIGLPASGKSTWAQELLDVNPEIIYINNDKIRNAIYRQLGHRNWSNAIEDDVRSERNAVILTAASLKRDIIIDNTHCNQKTFNLTCDHCKAMGFDIELVDFRHVDVNECIRRDAKREGYEQVGETVIRKMAGMLKAWSDSPKASKKSTKDPLPRWERSKLPVAIIVDIDGTLAEAATRNIFDETRVMEDLPRQHVVETVQALQERGVELIIFSGRSEDCRDTTTNWLHDRCQFAPGSFKLFMRASGDRRRDSVVKYELYEANILNQYSIMAVFDDREQVVRECWNTLGLPVFRCGVVDQDNF